MQLLNEVTAMTSIAEDLVGTPNCITQLSNFLCLYIILDGCSSHKYIHRFCNNNVSIIVNALDAILSKIF